MKTILFLFGWGAVLLIVSCGRADNDALIRQKLQVILESDLRKMTVDIPNVEISDSAHVTIVSYTTYSEGKFSRLAVVEFYFLKKVRAKIIRKYRYYPLQGQWERFFNEYRLY